MSQQPVHLTICLENSFCMFGSKIVQLLNISTIEVLLHHTLKNTAMCTSFVYKTIFFFKCFFRPCHDFIDRTALRVDRQWDERERGMTYNKGPQIGLEPWATVARLWPLYMWCPLHQLSCLGTYYLIINHENNQQINWWWTRSLVVALSQHVQVPLTVSHVKLCIVANALLIRTICRFKVLWWKWCKLMVFSLPVRWCKHVVYSAALSWWVTRKLKLLSLITCLYIYCTYHTQTHHAFHKAVIRQIWWTVSPEETFSTACQNRI